MKKITIASICTALLMSAFAYSEDFQILQTKEDGVVDGIKFTVSGNGVNKTVTTANGGKIQYVKYPVDYNIEAIRTLIRRAMEKGYYEGVNLSLAYCEDCGYQELSMEVCPKCGSHNLTKIERMNGYLSYSRVHGDTRLNDAKMAEIAERKSM